MKHEKQNENEDFVPYIFSFIYETGRHNGIAELLEILGR